MRNLINIKVALSIKQKFLGTANKSIRSFHGLRKLKNIRMIDNLCEEIKEWK